MEQDESMEEAPDKSIGDLVAQWYPLPSFFGVTASLI